MFETTTDDDLYIIYHPTYDNGDTPVFMTPFKECAEAAMDAYIKREGLDFEPIWKE